MDRNVKWQQGEVSYGKVALRKESVDRNAAVHVKRRRHGVALRKESVDRNASKPRRVLKCDVALRKESVDRNVLCPKQ